MQPFNKDPYRDELFPEEEGRHALFSQGVLDHSGAWEQRSDWSLDSKVLQLQYLNLKTQK